MRRHVTRCLMCLGVVWWISSCRPVPDPLPIPPSARPAIVQSSRAARVAIRTARRASRERALEQASLYQPVYWLAMYGERFEDVVTPYCERWLSFHPSHTQKSCAQRLKRAWRRTFLLEEGEGLAHACAHLDTHLETFRDVMRMHRVPKKARTEAREWLQLRRYICIKTITPMLFLLVKDGLWTNDHITELKTQPLFYHVYRPGPPFEPLSSSMSDEGDAASEVGIGDPDLARRIALIVRFELEPHEFMRDASPRAVLIRYYDERGELVYERHEEDH